MSKTNGNDWLSLLWKIMKGLGELILLALYTALQMLAWLLEAFTELLKKLLIK